MMGERPRVLRAYAPKLSLLQAYAKLSPLGPLASLSIYSQRDIWGWEYTASIIQNILRDLNLTE